jgi:hypothetical protein
MANIYLHVTFVWLPRKIRRKSLGLVLIYDYEQKFLGMGTLVGGPGDGQVKY